MLKRIIGIFLAGALALSLFLAVGCSAPDGQQNDPGGAQIETPGEEEPGGEVPGEDLPAGGDEDEVPEYTVTYYDSDGTTVLATEKFAEGEILANRNLGADRAGYSKSWTDKEGNAVSFGSPVEEDLSLYLRYDLTGAAKLYSRDVLDKIKTPAPIDFSPSEDTYRNYRYFAMNMSLEVTPQGRLWSCWIGGEDGPGAFLIATYSDDGGQTWEDIQFVIDPHDKSLPLMMNTHIGAFWCDPLGRLWLFYQQSFGMWDGSGANFYIRCDDPDASEPVWTQPVYIGPGASIKKPIVTSQGEWILPVSIWERWHITAPLQDCYRELDNIRGANVYASDDEGETWSYRGGVIFKDSNFNEHSVVELSDGRLMMYSRCSSSIKKSYSSDGGRTWTNEEVAFSHVNRMATIRTLPSGNLLLVKHGKTMSEVTSGRSNLTAYVSKDGGATWEGGLLLDERTGVAYPDIAFDGDGNIYVQYDYSRTVAAQILFAKFTEEDVLAGKLISQGSSLKNIVKDTAGIAGAPVHGWGEASSAFSGGDGSQESPYRVSTAENFRYLAEQVNSGNTFEGKYIVQTADISFGGESIQPVGYYLQGGSHKYPFKGDYDGGGFVLSDLRMYAPYLYCRGLFGYVLGGSLRNITLRNAEIEGMTNTGAIVGWGEGTSASNPLEIINCRTESSVSVTGYQQIGGIAGRVLKYVTIENCVNAASVSVPHQHYGSDIFVGGIAGYIENNAKVISCVNEGDIYAGFGCLSYVGGISGNAKNVAFTECVNRGTVILECNAGTGYVGGISGWTAEGVSLEYCANIGRISAEGLADFYVGGIVGSFGRASSNGFYMECCYNDGEIEAIAGANAQAQIAAGGLVGFTAGAYTSDSGKAPRLSGCAAFRIPSVYGSGVFAGSFVGLCANGGINFQDNATAVENPVGSAVGVLGEICLTDVEAASVIRRAVDAQCGMIGQAE